MLILDIPPARHGDILSALRGRDASAHAGSWTARELVRKFPRSTFISASRRDRGLFRTSSLVEQPLRPLARSPTPRDDTRATLRKGSRSRARRRLRRSRGPESPSPSNGGTAGGEAVEVLARPLRGTGMPRAATKLAPISTAGC